MEILKLVGNAVLWLAPPRDDPGASPESNAWRWKTFVGVLGLYALLTLNLLWFCGRLGSFGMVGVAWASDLQPIQQQLAAIQRNSAQDALVADQLKICRLSGAAAQPGAPRDLLQQALTAAQRDFQQHFAEFQAANNGRSYAVQPCSVILIAGGQ